MVQIYFAGGEDSDFYSTASSIVSTTAGSYRSTYARCSLVVAATSNVATVSDAIYIQNPTAFSSNAFWLSFQSYYASSIAANTTSFSLIRLLDSSQIIRIAMQGTGTPHLYSIYKINAAGTKTQLGSNFTATIDLNSLHKVDLNVNYNTSGSLNVYVDGVNVFTYSGDVTTDSVTSLGYIRLSCSASVSIGGPRQFSEIIVSDTDTRTMTLQTLQPVANGNTHTFDTGIPAAANVNEVTLNDATLDGSSVASQVDQYTVPSLAAGSWSIVGIGVSARMRKGLTSGPTKMDLGVRAGSTPADYWSSDEVLTTNWNNYQNWWLTDPSTSAGWAVLPVNIGLKSVT